MFQKNKLIVGVGGIMNRMGGFAEVRAACFGSGSLDLGLQLWIAGGLLWRSSVFVQKVHIPRSF